MPLIQIIISSLASVTLLFLLTKLMGYRQMSQLSMFDYINGITIGSIAAELAVSAGEDYLKPSVAMIVFATSALLLSILEDKSIHARRILNGIPLLLFHNGEIYYKNLKKAKLDMGEFLTQCRINGYFDLNNLHTALLEANGKISFLPKVQSQPPKASDLNLSPEQDNLLSNLIIDGKIMKSNLQHSGKDQRWLERELEKKGYQDVKKILLATCDQNNQLNVYIKLDVKKDIEILN